MRRAGGHVGVLITFLRMRVRENIKEVLSENFKYVVGSICGIL